MQNNNVFPGWEIVEPIGSGGFSKVYKIRKTDSGHSDFFSALKVIDIPQTRDEYNSYRADGYDEQSITQIFGEQVKEIVREFELMHQFRGVTNIVSFEDHLVIQNDDGIGWRILIRMELLKTLPDWFMTNSMTDEDVKRLGIDICQALKMCARKNIVHRDIKPQNIFANDFDDFKLGDFGVARVMEHTTRATKIGTYSYMAPEVYNGKPYNYVSDIYSLGMVLYWLLNERRLPFLPLPPAVPTPSMNNEAQMRRLNGEAVPAPKYGSEELKAVVLKACAFDPADRYSSAEEFEKELRKAETSGAVCNPFAEASAPSVSESATGAFSAKTAEPDEQDKTVSIFSADVAASDMPDSIVSDSESEAEMTEAFDFINTASSEYTDDEKTTSIFGNPLEDEEKTVSVFDAHAAEKPEAGGDSAKETKHEPAEISESAALETENFTDQAKNISEKNVEIGKKSISKRIIAILLVIALIAATVIVALTQCGDGSNTGSNISRPRPSAVSRGGNDLSAHSEDAEDVSDEISTDVSDEASDIPVEVTGVNIAGSAAYTTSALYRQGADESFGWDENAEITYPDEDGISLNDGKTATSIGFNDPAWVGFHSETPDYSAIGYHHITFDLGSVRSVSGAKLYIGTSGLGGGITVPSKIELYVSDDGVNYTPAAEAVPSDALNVHTVAVELPFRTSGRYVQFRIISKAAFAWSFVSEAEIYSEETVSENQTSQAPEVSHTHIYSAEWKTDETAHWHSCDCGENADTAAHSWSDWKVTKNATETATGSKERSCSACGYKETASIPVLSHTHSYSSQWNQNSSSHWHVCDCGEKSDVASHTYGSWSTVKAATCTASGTEQRTCSACGKAQTRTVSATGHTYFDGVCSYCDDLQTKGLKYTRYDYSNISVYQVTGIGSCTDDIIYIPKTYNGCYVASIGENAFSGCGQITRVYLPSTAEFSWIAPYAFEGCYNLAYVSFGNTISIIDYRAFFDCDSLQSIVLPDSVTTLGNDCFAWCDSLIAVVLSDSLTSLPNGAFTLCENLTYITWGSSITHIGNSAFWGCNFSSIAIPNTVTYLDDWAFAYCYNLADITIPGSVTHIAKKVFYDCDVLVNVKIPNSVNTIGDEAFYGCDGLETMVIPNSVVTMGSNVFGACYNESFTIGCRYQSKPSSWASDWLGDSEPSIIWGYIAD